jgi:hypothetical protein
MSDSARVSRVPEKRFTVKFIAGQSNFLCIDNNNMVTTVSIRGKTRLILPTQNIGNSDSKSPKDKAISINKYPLLFDVTTCKKRRTHAQTSRKQNHYLKAYTSFTSLASENRTGHPVSFTSLSIM